MFGVMEVFHARAEFEPVSSSLQSSCSLHSLRFAGPQGVGAGGPSRLLIDSPETDAPALPQGPGPASPHLCVLHMAGVWLHPAHFPLPDLLGGRAPSGRGDVVCALSSEAAGATVPVRSRSVGRG